MDSDEGSDVLSEGVCSEDGGDDELQLIVPENDECSVLEYDEDHLIKLESGIIEGEVSSIKADSCCYYLTGEAENFCSRLVSYMMKTDPAAQPGCLVNTVTNYCDAIMKLDGRNCTQNEIYSVIDTFLRQRHELLHNLSMMALRLNILETDQKFSEVFSGFPSDKTPDRIIVRGKMVLIIETTATLNVLKSYIGKGKIEEGFKSKYEAEINRLVDEGYEVSYIVLSFDVKNPVNESYLADLKKAASLLDVMIDDNYCTKIEMVRLVFCNYSNEITKTYSKEVTNLLTENFCLEKPNLQIDFLIVEGASKLPKYNRVAVSSFVYNKINSAWPRFAMMLERTMMDVEQKISPYLDHSTNKFFFEKNRNGLFYNDLMNVIVYDDKPTFCKLLVQQFDGRPFTSDRADIEFFDKTSSGFKSAMINSQDLNQLIHLNSSPWKILVELKDYSELIQIEYYLTKHHLFEDENYEDKLKEKLIDFYKNVKDDGEFNDFCKKLEKKPFSMFELSEKAVDTAVKNFDLKMIELNSDQQNSNIIRYQKQPFLLPLVDCNDVNYIDYRTRPIRALQSFKVAPKLEYTNQIFELIWREEFVWGTRQEGENADITNILQNIKDTNSKIYKLQFDHMKKLTMTKIPKLKDVPGSKDLQLEISNLNRELSILRGGKKNNLSVVRIPCKGKSRFKKAFNDEMQHFKSKRSSSHYKGIGFLDSNMLSTDFENLKFNLMSVSGKTCDDNILDTYVSDDATLLKQLKMDYIEDNIQKLNYLKNTNLYHSCAFISRLCHSLAFHSQSSMGSDYVAIDNLGYDKVILMIRGGKKIFKTKKTKLFRLLYPIHSCIAHWYSSPNFNSSTIVYKHLGIDYALTPWHSLDEVILNDGLTFLHRTMSYVLLCHERDISLSFEKCFFNVMLSFHARRKTEELLHNLRYVCVNSIANVSRLDLMFPELAGFNYDYFQCFIRDCLSRNFKSFSLKLIEYNNKDKVSKDYFKSIKLKNLFDGSRIDNLEDLTMTIYSTFLMSKSPTNQQLEQSKNLANMLKTWEMHEKESSDDVEIKYMKNNYGITDLDLTTYWNKLFESDFNYDTKFVVSMGKFSADYLSNIINSSELNSKWLSIVNRNWDEFANTKGLRGMDDEKFFNRKGYYIVYDELLKDSTYVSRVKELLTTEGEEFKKRKELKSLNKLYKDKLGCKNMKEAIFHVVDKKQRGGSREIFVMDLETKINQQAIEKMLAYICSKIPNEAISVPSNRRLQHIHANVFERFQKSDLECYNLTLDCRKWAPHSIINKFIDMILAMSGYLPESFVTHFLIFFSKMFTKKVYTRNSVHDILHKNERYKDLIQRAMKEDKGKSGYFMEMSYSWVMGIFNYMSSFMHVMNQIYASHLIMNVTLESTGMQCHYHMNAHSDDSGGKMQVQKPLDMKKTFFIYELLLKSCNHLLSDKKCNISKRYFEFLSVLYISNTLLSLISKISGSFNFHPTDTGYCGDINECYGKCIEMISSGATFDIAYLSMKISSHLVYKFYFNCDPVPTDYNLPPQLLGLPDCHPIMALIAGSDSDIVRLTFNKNTNFDKFIFLSNILSTKTDLNMDIIKPIIAVPFIKPKDELRKHIELINVDELDEDLRWVIKNFDSKNTALEIMKYGLMLKDKKFIAALIDENLTRRISRAYYFRKTKVCQTPWGMFTYKGLKSAIQVFNEDISSENFEGELNQSIIEIKGDYENYIKGGSKFNLYEIMNHEIYAFVDSVNKISYSIEDIVPNLKTCKPMHINMQKTNLPTSSNFNPATLCVWICYPKYRWLINMGDDYLNKCLQLDNFLQRHDLSISEMEPNWIYNLLQKMKSKYVKEYFIYSNVPHDVRDVSTYKDFLTFLAHNSFKGKVITGITIPLGDRIANPMQLIFQNQFNDDLLKVLTFLNYCFSICTDFQLFREVADLNIDGSYIKCKSTKLYPIINEIINLWELDPDNHHLVVPHAKSLLNHMNGELNSAPWLRQSYYYSFVKSQKLVGNVWLGKGIIYINTPDVNLEFHLASNKVLKIVADKNKLTFKLLTLSYINSVLLNASLPKIDDTLEKIDFLKWEDTSIGINSGGSLCIDKVRSLKLFHPNFEYKVRIMNGASTPEISSVSINKNFSYNFMNRNELQGDTKTTINVLKITPDETLNVLNKLYDNEYNRKLIDSRGEHFGKYMKMFIGVVSDIDLMITTDQLYDMYRSTKLYGIMRESALKGLITPSTLKNRKHWYPGQEGGLLSVLISYKESHPEFGFEPDLVLSPEMMSLKSSQPESFMSNLITNIKQKYERLYAGFDKNSIKNEIYKISTIIDNSEYQSKLVSLLTTWGYIGVMGALEEVNFVKRVENFKGIRNYVDNTQYASFNINIYKKFITALLNTAKKKNYFNRLVNRRVSFISKSYGDLVKCVISYTHNKVLSTYSNKTKILTFHTDMDFIKLCNSVKNLLEVEGFEDCLQQEVSDHPLLCLLPLDKSNFQNIMVMLETMTNSITVTTSSDVELRFDVKIQHDHNLIQPYTRTKNLLSNTPASHDLRAAPNHGFISVECMNNLNRHKLIKHDGKYYDISCTPGSYSELSIPFSKFIYIPNKLKEEIDEDSDEYYDISIELNGTEPDCESLMDVLPECLDTDYVRTSRVRDRGFLVNAERLFAKFFILYNVKGDPSILNLIRNSSTTIIIVTTCYLEDLVECQTDKIQIFNLVDSQWYNKSLTDPECLLYYVLDTKSVNVKIWERFLGANSVDKNELTAIKKKSPTNMIMTEKGEPLNTSKYMSLEEKQKMINNYDKKEEEDVIDDGNKNEVEKVVKMFEDDRLNELIDKGFDIDFVNIAKDFLKKSGKKKQDDRSFFQKLIEKYIDGKKLAELIKNKTKTGVDEALQNLSDVNKATKIFEVASVFSIGNPSRSDVKNRSLKDKLVRAEVNCMSNKIIDYILSGRLAISKHYKNIFNKHCMTLKRWALTSKKDTNKKMFLLNVSQLILNDAYDDDEQNQDELFQQLANLLTDKIVVEEDEDDYSFLTTYDKEANMGRLYYGWDQSG